MGTISLRNSVDTTYDAASHAADHFHDHAMLEAHARIVGRIHEVDMRIQTWKQIAARQGIDIGEEKNELLWLRNDFEGVIGNNAEEINLLRQEIVRKRLCRRIVQKVRKNFKRNIPEAKEAHLKQTLYHLNQDILFPWIKRAKQESVDIADETQVIVAATRNGMYTLSQASMQAKAVVLLQQLNHVTLCSARIIRKVFIHRINRAG